MNLFHTTQKAKGRGSQSGVHIYFSIVLATVSCLFLGSCGANAQAQLASRPSWLGQSETGKAEGSLNGQTQTPFVEPADYSPDIPTPESIIGHTVAEKAVRYRTLIRYMQALAKASEQVTLTAYGKTHEGRTLYYLTITSGANHKRLDEIKADNAKLSDPRKLKGPEQAAEWRSGSNRPLADRLVSTLPAVAWLNYSIHGDELSSTDAAIYVAYHLAAAKDAATRKLLDQVVVHINPLVNPDGRERYLSHLEQLTGVVSSPDLQSMQHQALWSRGRGNHYLFDLNRDWLVHVQPEVRALAGVILSWNPHLLVDSHEQGAYDTYLFDPPTDPLNIHLSPKVLDWRKRFGADHAKAFNRYGWSYYTKDWYSEWSPIYTNAWANMQGAIGLLYEQARVDAASVKHPTGEEISYRETVHHHIVSTLANLDTLCSNRQEILSDFLADRQWAINKKGPRGGIFLLPPSEDISRWKRLVELIKHQGIETEFAQEPFEAENVTDILGNKLDSKQLPKGTVVVFSAQPHRRMFRALCEFDPHLEDSFLLKERKEIENRRKTLLYDVSTWNLPMAFGIESYWAKSISPVELSLESSGPFRDLSKLNKKSGYGYLVDFRNSTIYPVLVRLFDKKCHPRIATKPFKTEGREYKTGTVLLRGHENPDDLLKVLQKIASDFAIDIHRVDSALVEDGPDLGGRKFKLLAAPQVAIASQWPVRSTSFGSVWYLLDYQLRLQSSPINVQNLSRIDLRKYNVLVIPDSGDIGRVLDKKAVEKIKRWVEGGGTLIAIGNSAAFAAHKDRGLSSVRLKRDVLDKLEEYEEAMGREKNARDIKIDPNQIWGTIAAEEKAATAKVEEGETKKPEESKTKADIEKLKRADEWGRLFSPSGTFLACTINIEQWLGFGLQEKLPVMFWGSNAFMSKHPVSTVVRLADKDSLRLSGLLWPEAKERIANTAYATVESVEHGQLILFATDPTYRMWLPSVQRLFLNAVLLGPGMGTSQPMPW